MFSTAVMLSIVHLYCRSAKFSPAFGHRNQVSHLGYLLTSTVKSAIRLSVHVFLTEISTDGCWSAASPVSDAPSPRLIHFKMFFFFLKEKTFDWKQVELELKCDLKCNWRGSWTKLAVLGFESSFSLTLKGVSSVFFGDKILMSKYI